MNKDGVLHEKRDLIDWVDSLKNLPSDLWFKPFKVGSWGIADVISHFISWDKFLLLNRVKPIINGEPFPPVQVDIDSINKEASNYARSGIMQEELINEFISIREELLEAIARIPEEVFHQPYQGNNSITLSDYFKGLIEHDVNHKEQIDLFIKENRVVE